MSTLRIFSASIALAVIMCCSVGWSQGTGPGSIRWKFDPAKTIPAGSTNLRSTGVSMPAFGADGTVFVFGRAETKSTFSWISSGMVFALEPTNGSVKWKVSISPQFFYDHPLMVTAEGNLIVSVDQNIRALDGQTGAQIWFSEWSSLMGNYSLFDPPALGADGMLYCAPKSGGTGDGFLAVISSKTGQLVQQINLFRRDPHSLVIGPNGSIFVRDRIKYFTGADEALVAFAKNGTILQKQWELNLKDWAAYSLAVGADGTIYLGEKRSELRAIIGNTGLPRWEFKTTGTIITRPIISARQQVIIGTEENLIAIDAETGVRAWETRFELAATPVAAANGKIYATANDGRIYGLDSSTGDVEWSSDVMSVPNQPVALGNNGTLYIAATDGQLIAMRADAGAKLAATAWPAWRQNGRGTATVQGLPPRFNSVPLKIYDGRLLLSLGGALGDVYQVEWSNDLISWTMKGVYTNSQNTVSLSDTAPITDTRRFYRARLAELR
jgi:outer membrane protein assembly factor BamB